MSKNGYHFQNQREKLVQKKWVHIRYSKKYIFGPPPTNSDTIMNCEVHMPKLDYNVTQITK